MKANELRVGNWVSKHGEQYQCGAATILMLEREESDVSPIPLTEEWLERFGFEKDGPGWYWLNAKDRFTDLGYSYNLTTHVFEFDNCDLPEVYFVHQLQNLFWALCGQELTIKEVAK